MKKITIAMLLTAFSLFLVTSNAMAIPIIDFGVISPTPGTINFDGGPLVGTNIEVDEVSGVNTPSNAGSVLDIDDGVLNFETGDLLSLIGNTYLFGGNATWGSISITGDIPALSLDDEILMEGIITSGTVLRGGAASSVSFVGFLDYKHEDLLDYYGLPIVDNSGALLDYRGEFNISFSAIFNDDGTFDSIDVLSGDIVNTPTPEPTTLLLLGTGLIGLAALGRRKFSRKG